MAEFTDNARRFIVCYNNIDQSLRKNKINEKRINDCQS